MHACHGPGHPLLLILHSCLPLTLLPRPPVILRAHLHRLHSYLPFILPPLPPRSCCHVYSRNDFVQPCQLSIPELPDKKQHEPDSEDELSPGRASFISSLSLRQKFASAGLLWPGGSGSAAAGAAHRESQQQQDGGGADTFRISTAMYPPTPPPPPGLDPEQPELVPGSPPSAPVLPMSARSLPSARRPGSSSLQLGTWAAAAPSGPWAAGAAASNRSAPSSTLNSARSTRSASGLLPAVEALSLPAQAALQDSSELQQAEQQAAAADGSSSGSALKRAGNALARLKLIRRN